MANITDRLNKIRAERRQRETAIEAVRLSLVNEAREKRWWKKKATLARVRLFEIIERYKGSPTLADIVRDLRAVLAEVDNTKGESND